MSTVGKTSIRCAVTGVSKAVRPDVYDARVEKYGNEETLRKNYISRDAKRMLRDGKTVEQIRQELGVNDNSLPTPEDLADAVKAVTTKGNAIPAKKKIVPSSATESTTPEVVEPAMDMNDPDMSDDVKNFMKEIS